MEPTGARDRPDERATVPLKSGAMAKVMLKTLNLLDCAKELKQEFHARLQRHQPAVSPKDRLRKLQAGRSISISRPGTTQSAAPTPCIDFATQKVLLKSTSINGKRLARLLQRFKVNLMAKKFYSSNSQVQELLNI